jgi:uncharacterized membrane protein (DUF2068 family)
LGSILARPSVLSPRKFANAAIEAVAFAVLFLIFALGLWAL